MIRLFAIPLVTLSALSAAVLISPHRPVVSRHSNMKTLPFWIIALAGLIALAGTMEPVAAQEAAPLQAGASAVDITPRQFPIRVRGRIRDRAHDALHSRALVFSDGVTTLALVVVDNLGVAEESCDEAKKLAATRCGIAPENVMIASTHTHSAPASNAKEGDPASFPAQGSRSKADESGLGVVPHPIKIDDYPKFFL